MAQAVKKESMKKFLFLIALCLSLFQLWTAAFGVMIPQYQRHFHYTLILILLFFLYPTSRSGKKFFWLDCLLVTVAVAANVYPMIFYEEIAYRSGLYTDMDMYASFALILLTLEGSRRVIGLPIVLVAVVALAYGVFGNYLPGNFGHRGFDIWSLATHSVLSMEGVLGVPMSVAATFIFMFVLFAAFLQSTGLGDFFIQFAIALVGRSKGGPAQAAVISSGCLGTISGSSTANVVGTGSITIPLMKSLGYRPHFAGGVEAAASTGGHFMPPIMGAAAFIMAEFLGVPYIHIVIAAAIPSFFYFLSIILIVRKEASLTNVEAIPEQDIPDLKKLLRDGWHLLLPIGVIVGTLLSGYTPLFSGLTGVISCYGVSFFRKSTRITLRKLLQTLEAGARNAIAISIACGCCGIVIGVVTITGVGLKIGYGIIALSGNSLFLTLVLTMLTSLLLGMGVPTTANYIITSATAAPALIMLDIHPIAAHLFVFYFGVLADITPPVAIASFTAAGLAKARPMKTALQATRLSFVAFIIPYFFIYNPHLLLLDKTLSAELVFTLACAFIGILALASALGGYWKGKLHYWERGILFFVTFCLLINDTVYAVAGLCSISLFWLYVKYKATQQLNNKGELV